MQKVILIPLSIAAIFVSGCSTPSESKSAAAASESSTPPKAALTAFEGSWTGHDVTPGQEGTDSLTVSGENFDFHGADANDWLKGTFTLREDTNPKQWVGIVTDCASQEYIGKKCIAIYRIENGTLTVAGYSPGDPNIPPAFDAPNTRQIVFKHNQ
jgi:uncharacterized protein (TIGR03067 family)